MSAAYIKKIAAQKAGIGVGFLPKSLIERELNTGELVALVVEQVHLKDRLYLAWKSSNRGQGLKRLVQMLRSADLVS
jgi:Transcriptional regulator